MGKAMEVVSGFATNPSTTFTALTMATGDSNAVRNFPNTAQAFIYDQWSAGTNAGYIRTTSPRIHDNVEGITLRRGAATTRSLWSEFAMELLYPQDTLSFSITGGAAETDVMTSLIYYTDLPGTAARLYNWSELQPRALHMSGVRVSITSGGTAGQYSGSVAINSLVDQFKANTDYAILGGHVQTAVATIGIKSADFGNLRVGFPGTTEVIDTRSFFVDLNRQLGMPTIPVFNAANKANTIVDCIDTTTATTFVVTLECLELSTPGGATQ
jgi:hypothetical protein